jgi:hypothetical protein
MFLPIIAVALTSLSLAMAEQTPAANGAQPNQSSSTFDLGKVARRTGSGFDFNAEVGVTPLSIGDLGGGEFTRRLSFRTDVGYLLADEPNYWGFGATLGLGPRHTFQAGPYVSLVHLWTGFWGSGAFLMSQNGIPTGSFSAGWSIVGAELQVSREEPVFFLKIRIPIGVPIFANRFDSAQAAASARQ